MDDEYYEEPLMDEVDIDALYEYEEQIYHQCQRLVSGEFDDEPAEEEPDDELGREWREPGWMGIGYDSGDYGGGCGGDHGGGGDGGC